MMHSLSPKPAFRTLLKRQFISLCLAATAIAGLGACQSVEAPPTASESPAAASDTAASATNTAELTTVRFTLSWLLQGVDAPLTLAIERGYFAEEGIEVKFERGFGSADTANKIAAGQYDMGFGDMYSMIEFNERNPDQKLVVVAVPYNKAPFALVTLKESGIDSVEEFEGKKLGAPAGDAPRRLWSVLADEVGVEAESVEWVTMEPQLRESFLLQGEVDGISGFIYSMLPSILKGGKTLDDLNIFYYKDNGLDFYGNVVIAQPEFLEQNPDAVRGFLRAYMRGMQDVLRDPEAGLASVIAAGDELMDPEAERLRLRLALENLLVNEEVRQFGLGTVDPARLETTIQQTVEGFGLQQAPTIDEVFVDDYLPPLEERQPPADSELGALS